MAAVGRAHCDGRDGRLKSLITGKKKPVHLAKRFVSYSPSSCESQGEVGGMWTSRTYVYYSIEAIESRLGVSISVWPRGRRLERGGKERERNTNNLCSHMSLFRPIPWCPWLNLQIIHKYLWPCRKTCMALPWRKLEPWTNLWKKSGTRWSWLAIDLWISCSAITKGAKQTATFCKHNSLLINEQRVQCSSPFIS